MRPILCMNAFSLRFSWHEICLDIFPCMQFFDFSFLFSDCPSLDKMKLIPAGSDSHRKLKIWIRELRL